MREPRALGGGQRELGEPCVARAGGFSSKPPGNADEDKGARGDEGARRRMGRTGDGAREAGGAGAREEGGGVAVREAVCDARGGEGVQHGLLHRELCARARRPGRAEARMSAGVSCGRDERTL